jgi:hypothetical protein
MTKLPSASCVVKVGGGRGFIIERRIRIPARRIHRKSYPAHVVRRRLVVTAAHCLPHLPPPHAGAHYYERTYGNLLSRLDSKKPNVLAECLFVDPVADIAVLGCPDENELYEEAEAYQALIDDAPALTIAKPRSGSGWLLSLSEPKWIPTSLNLLVSTYGVSLLSGPTESGMSGSPILNDRGKAVGVVVTGTAGPQPILTRNLPAGLLREVVA